MLNGALGAMVVREATVAAKRCFAIATILT